METVNPLETARNLKPGESKLVGFNSKKRLLQTYLVATTADEHDEELVNSNVKGEWRKLIPETWLNQ